MPHIKHSCCSPTEWKWPIQSLFLRLAIYFTVKPRGFNKIENIWLNEKLLFRNSFNAKLWPDHSARFLLPGEDQGYASFYSLEESSCGRGPGKSTPFSSWLIEAFDAVVTSWVSLLCWPDFPLVKGISILFLSKETDINRMKPVATVSVKRCFPGLHLFWRLKEKTICGLASVDLFI